MQLVRLLKFYQRCEFTLARWIQSDPKQIQRCIQVAKKAGFKKTLFKEEEYILSLKNQATPLMPEPMPQLTER